MYSNLIFLIIFSFFFGELLKCAFMVVRPPPPHKCAVIIKNAKLLFLVYMRNVALRPPSSRNFSYSEFWSFLKCNFWNYQAYPK